MKSRLLSIRPGLRRAAIVPLFTSPGLLRPIYFAGPPSACGYLLLICAAVSCGSIPFRPFRFNSVIVTLLRRVTVAPVPQAVGSKNPRAPWEVVMFCGYEIVKKRPTDLQQSRLSWRDHQTRRIYISQPGSPRLRSWPNQHRNRGGSIRENVGNEPNFAKRLEDQNSI